MHKQSIKLFISACAAVVLWTGPTLSQQTAFAEEVSATEAPDSTQFARGARTWADTCARCHNMRDPNELRADQWRAAVAHMRVRSGMTGAEARDVLFFLQGSVDVQMASSGTPPITALPVTNSKTAITGQAIYGQTCIACHGADGEGTIPGVTDLTEAEGPLSKTDEELVRNISNGFQSPRSLIAMPPKGGNPALTNEDIRAVLDYLRSEFGS